MGKVITRLTSEREIEPVNNTLQTYHQRHVYSRVERLFEITRLAKTPGLKILVLFPIDTIQNIFEFGHGLTPPVGARK
jgi:hypothetical protein